MKRTRQEVFADIIFGIENIALQELHNNIDYNNYSYIFEDYFDTESFNEDYEDLYFCTDNNQYVTIIKLKNK